MAERERSVQTLTNLEGVRIVDIPRDRRQDLVRILDESFEGWYQRHSKRMLQELETVRAAESSGEAVGLIMLKLLEQDVGYVFYVAVAGAHRRNGVGKLLLEDAVEWFRDAGVLEVFASVEGNNEPSERLFASEGFVRTSFGEVSKIYGPLRAINMYRHMVVVPGEILLHKAMKSLQATGGPEAEPTRPDT